MGCDAVKLPSRDGAAVARRAHNPKVKGSNPFPATAAPGLRPGCFRKRVLLHRHRDVGTNQACRTATLTGAVPMAATGCSATPTRRGKRCVVGGRSIRTSIVPRTGRTTHAIPSAVSVRSTRVRIAAPCGKQQMPGDAHGSWKQTARTRTRSGWRWSRCMEVNVPIAQALACCTPTTGSRWLAVGPTRSRTSFRRARCAISARAR